MILFMVAFGAIIGATVGRFIQPTNRIFVSVPLGILKGVIVGTTVGAINLGGVVTLFILIPIMVNVLRGKDIPIELFEGVITAAVYGAIYGMFGGGISGLITCVIGKTMTRVIIGGIIGGCYGAISWEVIREWYHISCNLCIAPLW